MKKCFLCQKITVTERHHIFPGPFRQKSEKYGLVVNLCHSCHNEPPLGAHHNSHTAARLKKYGQKKAMEENGWSIKDFIREFGRNYL